MESLGEILKRQSISRANTDTSSSAETEPQCPICKGAGFLYPRLPLGHPDFGKVVPCRCLRKESEESRLARLERYSNLGPLSRLTFDNLLPRGRASDPENQERFARALAAAKAFSQNTKGWLILTGVSGCGKTHLAAAIVGHFLKEGRPALFIVVPDLLDHLRATFSPNSEVTYDELFERVRDAPLLVLDDLGTQRSTPWAQEKLYQIINHRFNKQLPLVVTTNARLEEMEERLLTRLTDPNLAQVYSVGEKAPPLLQQTGDLSLALLSSMTFENFDPRGLTLTPEQRHSLEQAFRNARNFAESPEGWLVLLGPNGCGKTHLACAIANYQLRQGRPVSFEVVPDLLDHFRSAFSPESKATYDELFERVKVAPLLILDDLGTQSSTPWAQEKLYQILNYRYNARLPMVITSSSSLDEIEDRLSSRMADYRLSTVIAITAPDYRGDRKPSPPSKPPRGRRGR